MTILLIILIVAAIVGCILAGMNKCPLWVACLVGFLALALVALPRAGLG